MVAKGVAVLNAAAEAHPSKPSFVRTFTQRIPSRSFCSPSISNIAPLNWLFTYSESSPGLARINKPTSFETETIPYTMVADGVNVIVGVLLGRIVRVGVITFVGVTVGV